MVIIRIRVEGRDGVTACPGSGDSTQRWPSHIDPIVQIRIDPLRSASGLRRRKTILALEGGAEAAEVLVAGQIGGILH